MDAALKWVGDWGFFASILGAFVFLVLYSALAKWWRTWWGRQIFTFMAVIGVILLLAGAKFLFGDYPGIKYVRPVAYISLATILWWLSGVLVYYQVIRRGKKSD